MRTLIIAEAGVNHNGDLATAMQLVDVAAVAKADFVKFQTFKTELLVSRKAVKADYQIANTGLADESQMDMIRRLELDRKAHETLIAHCRLRGIGFLSTAFDLDSIGLLKELGQTLFKIPSGEITNLPYLRKIAATADKIILSTGMASMEEVEDALKVLLAGGKVREDITILHCNTEYPTPMEDVNLLAMLTMGRTFGTAVGYSDHTLGIEVPIAAVAMGAVCIEKHFTLSRNLPGPDHRASLEPTELADMVRAIRNIELAMGDGIKQASASELKNKNIARKSIHLATDLPEWHELTEADLVMKRPGNGISPMDMDTVIGLRLISPLPADYQLTWKDVF